MAEELQTIAGVERALDVLDLFAGDGVKDLGVTEIADRLDLSKAVVHRILSTFRVKGYVDYDEDDRRYRLGPRILTLGLSYLDRLDVRETARATMRELVEETNETATMSVRAGWSRVYVDQITPPRDIKMVVQLGSAHPLHAGASSKAMLAFLPDEMQDAYLALGDLEKVTDETVTSKRALRKELADIRQRGFAASVGERQSGAGSVAAPIFGYDGSVVAVLSLCGPVERFEPMIEEHGKLLVEATTRTSEELGAR